MAATPTGKHIFALVGVLILMGLGALLALWARDLRTTLQSIFLVIISLTMMSYLASGSLLTDAMGAVGVSIWKTVGLVTAEIALGAAVAFVVMQQSDRKVVR